MRAGAEKELAICFIVIYKLHAYSYQDILIKKLHFEPNDFKNIYISNILLLVKTQFEIKCRCGGHSVTIKFMTILQILVAKP